MNLMMQIKHFHIHLHNYWCKAASKTAVKAKERNGVFYRISYRILSVRDLGE